MLCLCFWIFWNSFLELIRRRLSNAYEASRRLSDAYEASRRLSNAYGHILKKKIYLCDFW